MRYFEESEQLASARQWLAEHGWQLAAGVGLALVAYVSVQLWADYRRDSDLRAAELYPRYQQAVGLAVPGASDFAERDEAAAALVQQMRSSRSFYAALASADLARLYVDADDNERAAELMQWAHEHASDSGLRQLLALRLARIWSAMGRHQDALRLLDDPDLEFFARYNEVRGDILLASGDWDAAAAAWQAVLDNGDGDEYTRLKVQSARQRSEQDTASANTPDAG